MFLKGCLRNPTMWLNNRTHVSGDYFRRLAQETKHYNVQVSDPEVDAKQVKVLQLINAYRFRGHEAAQLDPLGLWKRPTVAELDPSFHNLTEDDMEETFNVGSFAIGKETMKLKDIYQSLNKIYCGSIGAEYMHMTDTEQKRLDSTTSGASSRPAILYPR